MAKDSKITESSKFRYFTPNSENKTVPLFGPSTVLLTYYKSYLAKETSAFVNRKSTVGVCHFDRGKKIIPLRFLRGWLADYRANCSQGLQRIRSGYNIAPFCLGFIVPYDIIVVFVLNFLFQVAYVDLTSLQVIRNSTCSTIFGKSSKTFRISSIFCSLDSSQPVKLKYFKITLSAFMYFVETHCIMLAHFLQKSIRHSALHECKHI